ncbi:hypothetical protein MNBD_GAMMA26-568 [hydrothermal vent metagenome]|uniref:histidine kinase n=1 Tax=hydrothermal vent metagenome TaxID=652676 RepID=A0A3B1AR31_9ZZZZ
MKNFSDLPLKVRMIILVSFIVIASVFVITVALTTQHRHQANVEFDLRITSVMEAASESMKLAVLIRQKDEVERLVKSLLLTPDLISVTVYDANGELLASANNGVVLPEMEEKRSATITVEQIEIVEFQDFELFHGDENNRKHEEEVVGSIEAIFSTKRLEVNQNMMLRFAAQWTLVVILVAIGLSYYFADALTRPLARLVDATQKIADGDFTHTVENTARDEIGHLSKSFNTMVDELANDIEKRMQTEQALRKSEEHFQALANKAPVGIFQFDVAGACTFANPKCADIMGVTEQDVLSNDWVIWVYPGDQGRVHTGWRKSIDECCSFYSEFRFTHQHEQLTWVICEIYPERDAMGEVQCYIGTITDVTAQKIITEELKRSNDELDSFARIASHDLKEPMRKILAFGSILEEDYLSAMDEKGANYLNRIISAANRMQNLIDGLLIYSRVTTKAQPSKAVDLKIIIADVLSDLEVMIDETKGKVIVENLPLVLADSLQMRQLLQNLITNSLKYHRDDMPPEVLISSKLMGDMVEITISDSGIGFDKNHAERIFGVFERLHGRGGKYDGTGVGLSICKKIVERHGGTIKACGELGNGAQFIFTIPLSEADLHV